MEQAEQVSNRDSKPTKLFVDSDGTIQASFCLQTLPCDSPSQDKQKAAGKRAPERNKIIFAQRKMVTDSSTLQISPQQPPVRRG